MQNLILYGSGKRCKKICLLLQESCIHISCIVDSDESKWYTQVMGIMVEPPNNINRFMNPLICITIADKEIQEEIRGNIKDKYGYDLYNEISYNDLTMFAYQSMEKLKIQVNRAKNVNNKKCSIIFDCHKGLGLGGIEEWTKDLCSELIKHKWDNLRIMTDMGVYDNPLILKPHIDSVRIGRNDCSEKERMCNILSYLISHTPLIMITSQPSIVLMAASIVKKMMPEGIRIISVIHGGQEEIYCQYDQYKRYIDTYVGVSNDIKKDLRLRGILDEKIYTITCPVKCKKEIMRKYTEDISQPIRIGYAGRLEIAQKRMDLLLKLINQLENQHVNYYFEIAGDGSYKDAMKNYIVERKLVDKVSFMGVIKRSKISEFWMRQDICVNVADFEGRSITQLEAMANGAVPIVTKTSGTQEDILDGQNGYLVELGDYEKLAERIKYLSENRNKLKTMGQMAHYSIYPKCKKNVHTKFWEELLGKQKWILLNVQ